MAQSDSANEVRPAQRGVWLGLIGLVLAVSAASQWWAHRDEQQMGRQLASLAQPGDIQLVSSETCTYCAQARAWMSEQHVAFAECFIERDAACAARYRSSMMNGTPVVVVRGQAQLGFNPQRIAQTLRQPLPGA
jgi:glutaredoxin